MHLRLLLLFILALAAWPAAAEVRSFTDLSGRTMKGEVVSVKGDLVTIKREEGQTAVVKASNLCQADIEYLKGHGLQATPAAPLGSDKAEGRNLLSKDEEKKWTIISGTWKFENGMLSGEGESIIEYERTLNPPFTLNFEIKVVKGMRPRITLGPIGCFNEGYEKTLALYPPGRDAGFFPYEHNKSYKVSLVAGRKEVVMSVDGKEIAKGPGIKDALKKIRFSAGDGWSKGAVEYRDIMLVK
jgi:hypothetical protein